MNKQKIQETEKLLLTWAKEKHPDWYNWYQKSCIEPEQTLEVRQLRWRAFKRLFYRYMKENFPKIAMLMDVFKAEIVNIDEVKEIKSKPNKIQPKPGVALWWRDLWR